MSYNAEDSNIDNNQIDRLVAHLKTARDIAHTLRIQGMENRSFYLLMKETDENLSNAISDFEPFYVDSTTEAIDSLTNCSKFNT